MGNCINRPACPPIPENISETSSQGSMPDAEPWVYPGSYVFNEIGSPVALELARSKTQPNRANRARSEVSRFLDVTEHKNVRRSGEEGAELRSTSSALLRSTPDDATVKETRPVVLQSTSQ
jgi:hypothetical protein